ncbi:MAG: metallophosphoesterase [Xanthobacteraceae bacterium]|nr:metallophosphoesterase [Xanthobacteraceae bacterium]
MISRRAFLRLFGGAFAAGAGLLSYAFIEPRYRLVTTSYRFTPPGFPKRAKPLRIAAIADLHAVEPWMPLSRIEEIVRATNALEPDLIVLLGDYVSAIPRRLRSGIVPMQAWGAALAKLSAPLGTFAVLGNHDWYHEPEAVRATLIGNSIPVFENDATKLKTADGFEFWLAGLGDQVARRDDLVATMRAITDDAPALLLAHEPDIFPQVPERISLTLCGHTHGGQVRIPFLGPLIVPSRYGTRYAYGHIVEEGRHLVVSGGLGCTFLPVRVAMPPEIVLLELG